MSLFNRRSLMAMTAASVAASQIKGAAAQEAETAALSTDSSSTVAGRWTTARAKNWYKQQPWRVGPVYVTSTAANQLEMWQADTFDPTTIDRELGYAEAIGMNTVRVFLHDALYAQDPTGFIQRIHQFLNIAATHHISTFFVLFDSCWRGLYTLGTQPAPLPGIHNSQWVQSDQRARMMSLTRALASPKSIWLLSRKNSGFCTPA